VKPGVFIGGMVALGLAAGTAIGFALAWKPDARESVVPTPEEHPPERPAATDPGTLAETQRAAPMRTASHPKKPVRSQPATTGKEQPAASPPPRDIGGWTKTLREQVQRLRDASEDQTATIAAAIADLMRKLAHDVPRELRVAVAAQVDVVKPPEVRRSLGQALAYGGRDAEISRYLLARLSANEGDETTFAAICDALGGLAGPDQAPNLKEWLDPARGALAVHAAGVAAHVGGSEASGALLSLLSADLSRETRHGVEGAWRHVQDDAAFARAAAALDRAPPRVAESLLRVLRMRPKPEYAPLVTAALDRAADEGVVFEALQALAAIADDASMARLLRIIEEGGRRGQYAQDALRRIQVPEAVARATQAWDSLGSQGRMAVLQAAVRANPLPTQVLEVAERAVADEHAGVRSLAATVLGRPDYPPAVPALSGLLGRAESDEERSAALNALRRVGSREAAGVALAYLSSHPDDPGQAMKDIFESMRTAPAN
jgi:hypothetical protein